MGKLHTSDLHNHFFRACVSILKTEKKTLPSNISIVIS